MLLPLAACGASAGCGRSQAQNGASNKPPFVEVRVSAPVTTKDVQDYEDFPGRMEATKSVQIRARVSGYLDSFNFKEGADVDKDAVLFEIDARTYKAELAKAEGNIVQCEGNLRRLDYDFGRYSSLLPKGAVGREEYDKVVGDRVMAQGALDVARANRDLADLNLKWTKVRAPFSGRISSRFVDPGNLVKADDTVLTTIVQLDPIYATFDLDERTTLRFQRLIRAGKVKWSMDASLPVLVGLADETGYPRKGMIDFADNHVDADTGTWRLRALCQNPDRALSPGQFARVRLPIGAPYKPLLVAEQALVADQGQKFVYVVEKMHKVVNQEGKAEEAGHVAYRPVKVGRLHDGLRAILEGLRPGELVLISGLQRVRPDMEVTVVRVPMPVASEGSEARGAGHGQTSD
jgi:RND family efflux transporter MFP subunit